MPSSPLSEAVIICTRNRPDDLRPTLQSIGRQKGAANRRVLIIDASDPAKQSKNHESIERLRRNSSWSYHNYEGDPSLTRQRNYGISLLPPSIDVVHFLDDDVTLHPEYFCHLTQALHENPNLGGVGGIVYEELCRSSPEEGSLPKRLFLLDGPPGEMLSSGHAPTAQRYPPPHSPPSEPISTDFLNGCSASYRREILAENTFDPLLDAHALFEDLDFSYRVSRSHDLNVIPEASLDHHRSPRNRKSIAQYAEEMVVHRYWLVRKHRLFQLAFWWSVLGQITARLFSAQPTKWASLNGLLRGIKRIIKGDSSLLPPSA